MKNFRALLFIIVISIISFGFVLKGALGNPTPNDLRESINDPTRPYGIAPDRGRFILAQNLAEKGSFALTEEQAAAASPDVGFRNGRYYIYFAPGISVLAIPFYIIGSQLNISFIFTLLMSVLFTIANLIFIFLISRQIFKLPYWASVLASLVFGFASTALSYVGSLYQHQATVFLIMASFYAVYQYKNHEKWGFLWGIFVWLNYGLAISIDYPNVILMLPVMVYFFVTAISLKKEQDRYRIKIRTSILLTSVFFLAITFLHGYYNLVNYGGWTKLSGGLVGYKTILENKLDQGDQEENTRRINEFQSRKTPGNFLKEQVLVHSAFELLIAPDKGIFIFNPIFILGFLGIFYAFKKMDLEKGILISLVAVNLFFYSSWGDPWGGWAFGPRYLIPSMAILAIFVSYFLVTTRFRFFSKLIAFILIIFSSAVSVLGSVTTNAVPPKVEALALNAKYGFFFNIDFLEKNLSSAFIYNTYLSSKFSVIEYYLAICIILFLVFLFVIFIWPRFEKDAAHIID